MDGLAMIDTFLYTDEPAMAAGLRELLSGAPDVRLGHHCDNLGALKATLGKIQPDLLLLDVTPEVTVRTIYEVRECAPECRIVLWVRTVTKELAFQAIEHGVRGILRKNATVDNLLKCLRVVAQDGMWLEDGLAPALHDVAAIKLSFREGQLVSLLACGMKNKEAATALGLSEGTVKVYLAKLFKKLGVKDRFELAIHGLRNLADAEARLQTGSHGESREEDPTPAPTPYLRSIVVPRPSSSECAANRRYNAA